MAATNNKDTFDEDFSQLNWEDITTDMNRNKELLRTELTENIAVTSEVNRKVNGEVAIDLLYDVELQLTVEVGKKKLFISEVLKYDVGSIIELDNVVGQPLNIYIYEVLVGLGEIIEKEQKYGVKIIKILDEKKRLEVLSTKATTNI